MSGRTPFRQERDTRRRVAGQPCTLIVRSLLGPTGAVANQWVALPSARTADVDLLS
jgi:hypothetical protein